MRVTGLCTSHVTAASEVAIDRHELFADRQGPEPRRRSHASIWCSADARAFRNRTRETAAMMDPSTTAAMSTGAGSHVLQNAVPTAAPSVRRAGRYLLTPQPPIVASPGAPAP